MTLIEITHMESYWVNHIVSKYYCEFAAIIDSESIIEP
jgi:hypothetical protein